MIMNCGDRLAQPGQLGRGQCLDEHLVDRAQVRYRRATEAVDFPMSSNETDSLTVDFESRKATKSRRSCAYARTVFGDLSIAVKCARNLSTQSTTSPSRTTVADSTPDDISTRCTRTLLVMNTRDKSSATGHTAGARPRRGLFRHSTCSSQITESLLDRLINTSHQVLMDGPSYRPRKRPGRGDSTPPPADR